MEIRQLRRAALLGLALVLALAQSTAASAGQYFYDAAGRLDTEVLDGGRALLYDYDDRGNVLRKRTVLFAALAAAGDADGDGTSDRAVLRYDRASGVPTARLIGGTGATISTVAFSASELPVLFAVAPDVNANAASELALLVRDASNRLLARVRDGSTGALLGTAQFSATLTPVALCAIADLDGTGQRALALLARASDGSLRAEVRTLPAGTLYAQVIYGSLVQPAGFLALPRVSGVAELAVLDRREPAGSAIQVRRANGAGNRTIALGSTYKPQAFALLENADGAGTTTLAILESAITQALLRVRLLRATDGVLVAQNAYGSIVPLALAALAPQGAAPAAVAVAAFTTADRVRATVKQAISGAAVGLVPFDVGYTPVAFAAGRHDATTRSVDFLGLDQAGALRLTVANADTGGAIFSVAVP